MYLDRYKFIAVLEYSEEGMIGIYFPDLPGCTSAEETTEKAVESAKEALLLHLYGMEEDKDEIPIPSELKDIKLEKNELPLLVEVYMKPFREKMKKHFVKKTLSIPRWVNTIAEEQGINFSAVLLKGLKEQCNLE
ncbi:MAG: type II toxin-antitoxin system HicB family antitoxin [Oscillospiraceae bacterium]|nr:type II toxin-antitoxin system HicB family antitoxin [Oscillospiraceae bacterium]